MNLKIKILKTTPFDLEGTSIPLEEFKDKYPYLCSKNISDKELIKYLLQERHLYYASCDKTRKNFIGGWFEVQLYVDYVPSLFMYQDDLFTRENDDIWYSMLGTTKITLSREDVLLMINTSKRDHEDIPVYRD